MANSKKSISAVAAVLLSAAAGYGQCLFTDPPPPLQALGGGGTYASWNGWYLPTSGTLRILIVD